MNQPSRQTLRHLFYMLRNSSLCLLVLLWSCTFSWAQNDLAKTSGGKPFKISAQAFAGFEKCKYSSKLSKTMSDLIAHGKPLKKEDSAWTYAVESQFKGLPVKALMIGVCGESGNRDCGWAWFTAIVIARPMKETKDYLLKKMSIDFTQEIRDPVSEATRRPILVEGDSAGESVLFCDAGHL